MAIEYANNPYSVTRKYIETRAAAFTVPGDMLGIKKENFNQIFGVIVDIPLSANLLCTLICYINGAVNVYYNDGGAVENISKSHLDVAKVAQAFVISTQNAFDDSERVKSYPIPSTRLQNVYMITLGGIRKIIVDPKTAQTDPIRSKLFVGYNTVLNSVNRALKGNTANNTPQETEVEVSD